VAGTDRRGLGGHLDPRDQHLPAAAAGQQVTRSRDAECVEQRGVEVDDMAARVQPEHLELGPDSFRAGHLGQTARRREPWSVPEVEGQLGGHLVGGAGGGL
jgi:hypothetical protein